MQRSIVYIWSSNFCFWIWIWPQNFKNLPFKYAKYFLGSQIISILRSDSNSVAKINLNWYQICHICQKKEPFPGNPEFQILPRRFQDWWNFWISHWKSSSLTKPKWEKYPTCWNQPKPGIPGFLESWIPGSKNPKVAPKCAKNHYKYSERFFFFDLTKTHGLQSCLFDM